MGQKVHPIGFRLGITKTWSSKWYADKEYSKLLQEDITIRDFVKKNLYHTGISKIEIERAANKAKINIHTARPGIVIGRKGIHGQVRRQLPKNLMLQVMAPRLWKAEAWIEAFLSGDRRILLSLLLDDHRTKSLGQAENLLNALFAMPLNKAIGMSG